MPNLSAILITVCFLFAEAVVFSGRGLAATKVELNLKETIARVEENANSKAALSGIEEKIALEETRETFATFYGPRLELISSGGAINDAEGDITSQDTNDNDNLGPFFKADFKVIQPLYSFGKYDSARDAGMHNLEMKKSQFLEVKNDLRLEGVKAYFGVVAGQEGRLLSEELRDSYNQLIEKIDKHVSDPKAELDDTDLLEARTLHFEIEKQCAVIDANAEQALLLLKGLLALEEDTQFAAVTTPIPEIPEVKDMNRQLQAHLRDHSPALHGLQAGMEALNHKIELERCKRYPDLFLALGAGYGKAPGRDQLDNAYVEDEYNYEKVGGSIGLKWELNYGVSEARREKGILEYQKLVKQRQLILQQKEGAIARLGGEAVRKRRLYEAASKSLKSATTWVRLEVDNMDVGLGNVKRLVKSYQYLYQLKGEVISTRTQYLVTLAELAHAAGDTNLLLNWMEYGKVTIH